MPISTGEYTVGGIGTDYPGVTGLTDAIADIIASTLTGDLTFNVKGDINWAGGSMAANLTIGGNWTLKITSDDYHYGNYNEGHLLTLGAQSSICELNNGNVGGTTIVENIKITGGDMNLDSYYIPSGTYHFNNAVVRNCIFNGMRLTLSNGRAWTPQTRKISNNKFYNCVLEFISYWNFPANPANTWVLVENNTIYNQANVTVLVLSHDNVNAVNDYTYRNNVFANLAGVTKTIIAPAGYNYPVFLNNATSDDRAGALAWGAGSAGNVSNIVPADEFDSLLIANARNLFLKEGVVTADWTREPAGDVETFQNIKFNPEVTVTPGAVVLNDSGIAPTLESVDITGQAIPNSQGEYPIGCHVQEYSV